MGMTREQYFEMCEMMGSEPLEEEIPIEFDDLPTEAQEALHIYNNLQDCWDYMGGNYIGKNMNNFRDVFEIYDVPQADHRFLYELICHIDRVRAKQIQDKKPKSK